MTLRNPVDNDRIRLFSKDQQKEYLRQCDMADGGCNDAELVDEMRREGTLKVLDPEKYGRPGIALMPAPPKELFAGYGFYEGQPVIVTTHWPWGTIETKTHVQAVIKGGFIRTEGNELYPVRQVRADRNQE